MAYNIKQATEILDNMINGLDEDSFIDEVIEGLKEIKELISTPDIIYIAWGVEDVLMRAGEREIAISDENARRVLEKIKHYHDASIGISWDTIDYWLDEYERGEL